MECPLILGDGLLVGEALHRAVAGPTRVGQRLRALAGARGLREVPAQLRDVAVRVGAVAAARSPRRPPGGVPPGPGSAASRRSPRASARARSGSGRGLTDSSATTPSATASEIAPRIRSPGRSQAGPTSARSNSRPTTAAAESTWTASAESGASRCWISVRTLPGIGTPGPAGLFEPALGGEQPDRLPHEQRVALGRLVDGLDHRLRWRRADEVADQASDVVARQPAQGHQLAVADQLSQRTRSTPGERQTSTSRYVPTTSRRASRRSRAR